MYHLATQPVRTPFLSVAARINLDAVAGKKTRRCFIDSRYSFRDGDFDRVLPKRQPKTAACTTAILAPSQDATFPQWAAAILGVSVATQPRTLDRFIKERNYIATLPQVEEAEHGGKLLCMNTIGKLFFFVENKEGNISVGGINLDGGLEASIWLFDSNCYQDVSNRFFIPNWDLEL